tara:strand:+ start:137 stop:718 length:582 start_codon:yes stop_codon:yes gene_type:complete
MTPRLKLLSALLCVSIVYAVYDYIDRNNIGKAKELTKRKKFKRARTAGMSSNSAKLRKIRERQEKRENEKALQQNLNKPTEFNPLSEEYSGLSGWARNPFVKYNAPKEVNKMASLTIAEKAVPIENKKTLELNSLDRLTIETAVRMGEKAFVTINGKTFREGDLIEDALIEKIENEQVTFKIGTTKIIKNVGL